MSRSSLALMESMSVEGGSRRLSRERSLQSTDALLRRRRSPAPASSAGPWRSRWRATACGGAARRAAAARRRDDVRAYALNAGSVALLRGLRSGTRCPATPRTPVHDMLVHGDAAGAALEFSAWEQRVGELAWIIDAAALERELDAALRFAPHVTRVDADVPARPGRALRRPGRGRARRPRRGIDDPVATARRRSPRGWSRRGRTATSRGSGSARPTCSPCCRSTGPSRSARTRWSGRCRRERAEALLALDAARPSKRELAQRHRRRGRRAALGLRARRLAAAVGARRPPGAARAGCWPATPRTSCIRSPARA